MVERRKEKKKREGRYALKLLDEMDRGTEASHRQLVIELLMRIAIAVGADFRDDDSDKANAKPLRERSYHDFDDPHAD